MANRRMFSLDIVDTDKFLELPAPAQALYFHLGMRADDDGFVSSARKICKLSGAELKDLELLVEQNYLIAFENGVYVIVDWKLSNTLKRDRYKATVYQELFNLLTTDANGRYRLLDTEWNQNGTKVEPQDRLGKDRVDKGSIDKVSVGEKEEEIPEPPAPEKNISENSYKNYGEYSNVCLTDEEIQSLEAEFYYEYKEYIEKLSSYIASTGKKYNSHFATIKRWVTEDREKSQKDHLPKRSGFNNYEDTNHIDYDALEKKLLDSMILEESS